MNWFAGLDPQWIFPLMFAALFLVGWGGRWCLLKGAETLFRGGTGERSPLTVLRGPSAIWILLGALLATLPLLASIWPGARSAITRAEHLLTITLLASILWVAADLGGVLIGSALRRNAPELAATTFVSNGARLLLLLLGGVWLLDAIGVSVAPILTAVGVGGVSLALALQATLADVAAGCQILMGRQIGVGDRVKLAEGDEGVVRDIGWRNTVVVNGHNNMVLIPNRKLSEQVVVNFSRPDPACKLIVPILVPVDRSPRRAREILEGEASAFAGEADGILPEPPPQAQLVRLDRPEGAEFQVTFQIRSRELEGKLKSAFQMRLWERLQDQGIFPALDGSRPNSAPDKSP